MHLDKNIVISGGAGDIGIEIATEFAKTGANKIALLDNNAEQLNKGIDILKALSCDVVGIKVDLADEKSIEKSVKET